MGGRQLGLGAMAGFGEDSWIWGGRQLGLGGMAEPRVGNGWVGGGGSWVLGGRLGLGGDGWVGGGGRLGLGGEQLGSGGTAGLRVTEGRLCWWHREIFPVSRAAFIAHMSAQSSQLLERTGSMAPKPGAD